MSANLIQHAFIAGELSYKLFGRTDLEKYALGLARGHNWFIDFQGGASTRAGTQFGEYLADPEKASKFVPFKFSPETANTYLIVFGDETIRFIQNNAYVLEDDVAISNITQSDPGSVTSTAHGFSTGDWIYLSGVAGMTEVNGRLFEVGATTSDTFELLDPLGNNFDTTNLTTYTSGGVANRVYTVVSPYTADELRDLRAYQIRDLVRLTHKNHRIMNLTRTDHANWSLAEEEFGAELSGPTNLNLSASSGASVENSMSTVYTVTSVDEDGTESLAIEYLKTNSNRDNPAVLSRNLRLTWDPVADAVSYNVYRSIYFAGENNAEGAVRSADIGYIGRSTGVRFTDSNIIADFTKTPPEHFDPFANGAIKFVEVTNGGSGYDREADETIPVTDSTGSGAILHAVVTAGGVVEAVIVVDGGQDYTSPNLSDSFATGSGATFSVTLTETSGNNPRVSALFQQRQVYGATDNEPLTVWGSKPGALSNFDRSVATIDSDSYEYTIDADQVSPIKHLLPIQGGLMLFSDSGIWRLSGEEGGAVTPLSAVAEPQTLTGISDTRPLGIDNDILYVQKKGAAVRLLSYNDLAKVYAGRDMSVLSSHLFSVDKQIENWAFAEIPFRVAWAQRTDGALLAFTHVPEQNVEAWTPCWTKGLFKDVAVIEENNEDVVYLAVKRKINGSWVKFFERMDTRQFKHVEEAWCVDAGLTTARETPDAILTMGAATGDGVTFTASAAVFSAGDVGKVIRAGGGKATIVTFTSSTEVVCDFERDVTLLIPESADDIPQPVESGNWTMTEPITTVSGLWHLEGEAVAVLADGNVVEGKTVTDGQITLDEPASYVIVGLPYECIGKTLPLSTPQVTIEGRRKKLIGLAVRVADTRGLRLGSKLDKLYEMKDRTVEGYGQPIKLRNDISYQLIDAPFDLDGQTYFAQRYPLPASVLGFVYDTDVGDDLD